MSRRVVALAVAGVLGVLLPPVRAGDPASSQPERPAQAQAEDNDLAQADPRQEGSRQTDPEETSWTFDRGLYTNDPKTGARVWRYAKKKPSYRDPYSFLDSPHEAFPFAPDPYYGPYYSPYYGAYPYYGIYPYAHPYPYGPMPYAPSSP